MTGRPRAGDSLTGLEYGIMVLKISEPKLRFKSSLILRAMGSRIS